MEDEAEQATNPLEDWAAAALLRSERCLGFIGARVGKLKANVLDALDFDGTFKGEDLVCVAGGLTFPPAR